MSIDIEPDRAREVLLSLKQRRGEYATNRQLLGDAGGALDAIEEIEAIDFALASMAELKALRERVTTSMGKALRADGEGRPPGTTLGRLLSNLREDLEPKP